MNYVIAWCCSYWRPNLGCLPLWWLLDPIQGGCCGFLLDPLATEHSCHGLCPCPIRLSNIASFPALVGLFSCCSAATESTPWMVKWNSSWPKLWVFAWQFPRPQIWTSKTYWWHWLQKNVNSHPFCLAAVAIRIINWMDCCAKHIFLFPNWL